MRKRFSISLVVFIVLNVFLCGCGTEEQNIAEEQNIFPSVSWACVNYLKTVTPKEYLTEGDGFDDYPEPYIRRRYANFSIGEGFGLYIVTTADGKVYVLCAKELGEAQYSCDGNGCISYDYPITLNIEDCFTEYITETGERYVYGMHAATDATVYINGIEAQSEKYTFYLNEEKQYVQFTCANLGTDSADEEITVTY